MKFLIIHNRYSKIGGEENVVQTQENLLRANGHSVLRYERSYDEIATWKLGKISSFFSALYNARAVREITVLVEREKPDVALIHNLFPVISPAILPVLKKHDVITLLFLHNFRLICPTGLFFHNGLLCEKCGSRGREIHCLLNRCQGTLLGSAAYALRNYWARARKYYLYNIDRFVALTEFQRNKLIEYGIPANKLVVLSNCIDTETLATVSPVYDRKYVGFVGRLSAEKGIDLLLEAARRLPHILFRIAGERAAAHSLGIIPPNVTFTGFLNRAQLAEFYACARLIVMASRCYEGFSLVVLESYFYNTPIVAPRLGGFLEITDAGRAGLLYTPGDPEALTQAIDSLFHNPQQSQLLSAAGKALVLKKYTQQQYYQGLLQITHSTPH